MFSNYVKVAMRNLLRQKMYSFINVGGLGLGMAACVLILLWVQGEMSYDRFHENSDHLYRMTNVLTMGGTERAAASSAAPMAPAVVEKFPEVTKATRIIPGGGVWLKHGEKQFREDNIVAAEPSFFELFSFPMIAGNPSTALTTAYTMVLTEETATKYFGDGEALGQTLRMDDQNDYTVMGVIEDIPVHSHITFDILVSLQTTAMEDSTRMQQWGRMGTYSYLLLEENADAAALESKLNTIFEPEFAARLEAVGASIDLYMQKMTDIHLRSNLEGEFSENSDITYVYLFTGIAAMILLMACFNFVNLATARSYRRAREVCVRKTFGAQRSRLVTQFLTESVLCALMAILLATILLEIVLPFFNDMTGGSIVLSYIENPLLLLGIIGFSVLVGLLAGCFPAFHLSSFEAAQVLKRGGRSGQGKSNFRRVLVVVQFSITIALLVGTLAVYQQIDYLKNIQLGYDKEELLAVPIAESLPEAARASFRSEVANLPGVLHASAASSVPANGFMITNFLPEGFDESEGQLMSVIGADEHYLDVMGLELIAGRNFSGDLATDSGQSIMINETAVRKFGWDEPIGKIIQRRMVTPEGPIWSDRRVVGVVADFHFASPRQLIEPLIILREVGDPQLPFRFLAVRTEQGDDEHILGSIEGVYSEMSGGQPFDHFYLDDTVSGQYVAEERLGDLAISFSLLAVFIGCLGLFGMASHSAEQRTKEIGIRRTLGAPVRAVVWILSRESLVLVALANILAWPVAGYIMTEWLAGFAYRREMDWTVFALAGLLTLVVAQAIVNFQSFRAASADPVKSLRYE
ncbi:MAG: ABC transporter permease [candidate division Zixibacteria bacterium]